MITSENTESVQPKTATRSSFTIGMAYHHSPFRISHHGSARVWGPLSTDLGEPLIIVPVCASICHHQAVLKPAITSIEQKYQPLPSICIYHYQPVSTTTTPVFPNFFATHLLCTSAAAAHAVGGEGQQQTVGDLESWRSRADHPMVQRLWFRCWTTRGVLTC